ncbi:unnamed protein product [Dicrocoelium dendriticum]|nr:unnamed protein product [Dicrocoelium dendriticum]
MKVGVRGSAFSQVITYAFQFASLLAYVIVKEKKDNNWAGFSSKLWLDWGTWFKLGLPGLVMVEMEWTIFELGTVIAVSANEFTPDAHVYRFHYILNIWIDSAMCVDIQVPLGFGIATNIRVGQFLGAGSSVGPKSVLSVALVTVWLLTSTLAMGVFLLRWQLPKAFTSDSDVIELTAHLFPIIAVFQIFDGTSCVCMGAIRGAGLQFIGAITCVCSQYLLGVPIALMLIFLAGYGIKGFWIGVAVGFVSQAIIYGVVCCCINWKKQVELARERTKDVRVAVPGGNALDGNGSANSTMAHYNMSELLLL